MGASRRTPILPLHLFTSSQFRATNLVTFVVYGALGGALFLLPLQLQQVSAYSPLAAGVALLPITVLMLLLSARSGALAARIGPRLQMSAGLVLVGLGLGLFVRIGPTGDYLTHVLPGITVLGLGLAVTSCGPPSSSSSPFNRSPPSPDPWLSSPGCVLSRWRRPRQPPSWCDWPKGLHRGAFRSWPAPRCWRCRRRFGG